MAQEFRPVELNERDVLSLTGNLLQVSVFKSALKKALNRDLGEQFLYYLNYDRLISEFPEQASEHCFDKGMECEILRVGDNWKKGKIRFNVTVEFLTEEEEETPAPPENESPLDDIRRLMKE
ncbi:hypothetical protein NG798_08410 [Ancylothrix sp. C2]|uniref:KGK domain-containing protein n=1 Tax=Ancylothrix sp. D3o TaxID=2953691 RepID=UPI0021BAA591|nr:KGK domain-containing protein [Ancylothrix sp. D3o]MCT7949807.1 hypothetical protein [Ancylothrix sp. D3o]